MARVSSLFDVAYDVMLSRPAARLPSGEGLVLEPKWDGYRWVFAYDPERGRVSAFTRHGLPHAGRFPYLEDRIRERFPSGAVIDGELLALAPDGRGGVGQDFHRLASIFAGRPPHQPADCGLYFVAFDLLELAGEDLRAEPWHVRRAHLEEALTERAGNVSLTPAVPCELAAHERHLAAGFEGSVVKRREGHYLGGRRSWVKVKARHELDVEVLALSHDRSGTARILCASDGEELGWAEVWDPTLRAAARRGDLRRGARARIRYPNRTVQGRLREARVTTLLAAARSAPKTSLRPVAV